LAVNRQGHIDCRAHTFLDSQAYAGVDMRYLALCCDYDGTIAHNGLVDEATLAALERLLASGRRLLLVTGRELADLKAVFPRLDLFDQVVAENGALVYTPATGEARPLTDPPHAPLVQMLRDRGVTPLSVGRCIVATWRPNETIALESIRELGLELQVIFNKGAVMILPSGINKATGLTEALGGLGLSPRNAIGVGDAENDHAFLALCECSAAVANALAPLKEKVDIVTAGHHGAGVTELIDEILRDDLGGRTGQIRRHLIPFAAVDAANDATIEAGRSTVLVIGTSGSGKSTVAKGLLERIADRGYSFCIIDPEGDYEGLEGAVTLGTADRATTVDEAMQLFEHRESAVLNLLGMKLQDRPAFFEQLLPRILAQRARTGHPHWIFVDEAHHLLPQASQSIFPALPERLAAAVFITVHPDLVAIPALKWVDIVIAVGDEPVDNLREFVEATGQAIDSVDPQLKLARGEALLWTRGAAPHLVRAQLFPSRADHRRHSRKYAEGELPPDRSFYFRGPDDKLSLRAQNLVLFMQMADGVGDEVWVHHFRRGDFSKWIAIGIKDEALAEEVRRIESMSEIEPTRARDLIRAAIERSYTQPT
jgi:hydroxymethylpyrimidine pyrophosphatase-like HAD family hydrolase